MSRVKIDSAGLEEVLLSAAVSSAIETRVRSAAQVVESNPEVQRVGAPVEVWSYEATGGRLRGRRAAWAITIRHPAGLGLQARYGVLTRAVSSAGGLQVKAKRGAE